jgi:hypothetical protein
MKLQSSLKCLNLYKWLTRDLGREGALLTYKWKDAIIRPYTHDFFVVIHLCQLCSLNCLEAIYRCHAVVDI